jgi:hypothetical protein
VQNLRSKVIGYARVSTDGQSLEAQQQVLTQLPSWIGSPEAPGICSTSIARGITDQDNKDGPELLASVNPTFTWVRLAQRIPVRIRLTDVPSGVLIATGMTCTVTLKSDT